MPGATHIRDWLPRWWYAAGRDAGGRVELAPLKEPLPPFAGARAWDDADGDGARGLRRPAALVDDPLVGPRESYAQSGARFAPAAGAAANFSALGGGAAVVGDDGFYVDYGYVDFAAGDDYAAGAGGGDRQFESYVDDYGSTHHARVDAAGLRAQVEGDEVMTDRGGRGPKLVATAGNWAATLVSV